MSEIIELNPDHIPVAGELLARSLFDDSLARYMYPDEVERRAKIPWHFSAMVRYGVLFGHALTTADLPRGVAIWLPPGETAMTDERIAAAGLDASPAMLGEEPFGRFMTAMMQIEQYHEQDIPGPHWYLALIGVDPDHAGAGIGSALIASILRRADVDGLPCYLETAEERNVGFYQRHGFTTVRHGTFPDTGLEYWTMQREPAAE